jgi:hypothetical protein
MRAWCFLRMVCIGYVGTCMGVHLWVWGAVGVSPWRGGCGGIGACVGMECCVHIPLRANLSPYAYHTHPDVPGSPCYALCIALTLPRHPMALRYPPCQGQIQALIGPETSSILDC